jgi:hypothetical protein
MQKFLIIAWSVRDGWGSTAAPAGALAPAGAAEPASRLGAAGWAWSDVGGTSIQSVGLCLVGSRGPITSRRHASAGVLMAMVKRTSANSSRRRLCSHAGGDGRASGQPAASGGRPASARPASVRRAGLSHVEAISLSVGPVVRYPSVSVVGMPGRAGASPVASALGWAPCDQATVIKQP